MIYGSVCSGIEAATSAWHPLGWRPAFFAEVAKFPSDVLAHHYPDTPNFGDFTLIEKDHVNAAIDVLVGGTPCQDFSVAGLRAGLAGERGQLSIEYIKLAHRLRPRWLVWENVPGVLSSNGGDDFRAFLSGVAGWEIPLPEGGWQNAGVANAAPDGRSYGLAWRVLDAQFIRVDGYARAVPQRRRRVFVVGYLGDWRRAAAVLLERESLCGNSPPRRQSGQGSAGDTSPCLTSSGRGVERAGDTRGQDPVVAVAFGGNNTSGPIDVATAQNAHGGAGRMDFETETFVAHALRAEGFDASEDGTGRGTPLVPVAGTLQHGKKSAGSATCQDAMSGLLLPICFDETQITSAENRSQPEPGDPSHPLAAGARPPTIAFSCKDHGADAADEVSPTLRAMGHSGSHPNAGGQMAVAAYRTTGNDGCYETGDVSPCLNTATDPAQTTLVQNWSVRRLTPKECERLQGFADDFTRIPAVAGGWRDVDETEDIEELQALGLETRLKGNTWRVKDPDGPRYKALGNSMAVNCMRWIGMRIDQVDAIEVE